MNKFNKLKRINFQIDKMVKICTYCSMENQDNFNFCSNCGRPLVYNKEKRAAIDFKKLIIASYIITVVFSWGGLIFNTIFNSFGFFGFIGLFLPFYLIQSKNPIAKRHGYIQIAISLTGIFISSIIIFNIFKFF